MQSIMCPAHLSPCLISTLLFWSKWPRFRSLHVCLQRSSAFWLDVPHRHAVLLAFHGKLAKMLRAMQSGVLPCCFLHV